MKNTYDEFFTTLYLGNVMSNYQDTYRYHQINCVRITGALTDTVWMVNLA